MKLHKFKSKKSNTQINELDITSMLDILVILLIFLLQNFSASELTVNVVDELTLPYSLSRAFGSNGIIVQVDTNKNVFLNNKALGKLNQEDDIHTPLAEVLESEAKKQRSKMDVKQKTKPLFINLVFDKNLEYESIQVILKTAAQSGFGRYKLIIQGFD